MTAHNVLVCFFCKISRRNKRSFGLEFCHVKAKVKQNTKVGQSCNDLIEEELGESLLLG